MLKDLPFYIPLLFILVTIVTYWFFMASIPSGNKKLFLICTVVIVCWLALQYVLSNNYFYTNTKTIPPRFVLAAGPPFLLILILFITQSGRRFIDSLSPKILTQLHVIRIFVEIVLWWLFLDKYIPRLMTFEGRNFDIISGITAPFIAYYGFVKQRLSKGFMLAWNVICLLLLINIVVNAILSTPFPFQQFAFDQPNVAVLYFPFIWLPGFIVPMALFSHLVLIRQLTKK